MTSILKTAAIAAILTGFANTAAAIEFTPLVETEAVSQMTSSQMLNPAPLEAITSSRQILDMKRPKTIAVARLHEGRFLPLPHQEAPAWQSLNDGGAASFAPLPAAVHFDVLAPVPLGAEESDNRIDEIRLAAIDAGQDYVLIYAVNRGASWGRFGDQDLAATGLTYDEASDAVRAGDAKALLIQTHTGEVIGAVTTFAPDMKTLTELVSEMTKKSFTKA